MSAEQWEALAIRAAAWIGVGPCRGDPASDDELAGFDEKCIEQPRVEGTFPEYAGLALFARLMSLVAQPASKPDEPSDAVIMLRCGGDKGWTQIKDALRRVHDGSDRGQLKALLCEAWGPSPAIEKVCLEFEPSMRGPCDYCGRPRGEHREGWTSDLKALAARESQEPRTECTDGRPCCERRNVYNGFGSDGPRRFTCPKGCACHD